MSLIEYILFDNQTFFVSAGFIIILQNIHKIVELLEH